MIKEKIQKLLLGQINFEEVSKNDENYNALSNFCNGINFKQSWL